MAQIKPLIPELQKVAIEELGEVPARLTKDLNTLNGWMQQQPHFKPFNDDQYLTQFLRVSKYSLERAKERLDFWLSVPKEFFVEDIDEPNFQQLVNKGLLMPLPRPFNGCGPRIVLLRMNFDPEVLSAVNFKRYFITVHHVMVVDDPYACINGCIYCFDLANFTAKHLVHFNLSFLNKFLIPVVKMAMFRIKRIYILNTPNYAVHLIKFFVSLMSDKIRKRVVVCNTGSDIGTNNEFQHCLPVEYGGENGCLQQLAKEQANVFDGQRESLKRIYEVRCDERLRMGKSPFESDAMLGTEGSFRSINVD